jgi:hypothetical protein
MRKGFSAMDHDQALQADASTRYALGELTPEERDAFEEHFADCSVCMNHVETAAAFAANTRQVFLDRASRAREPKRFAWLQWRPLPALAFSTALNLALAAGLGYAVLMHRPAAVDSVSAVEIVPIHGTTRAAGGPQVVRMSSAPVVLTFDLPQHYDRYFYSITREGASVLSGELTLPGQADSLNVRVPAGRLGSGEYRVEVTGAAGAVRENIGNCVLQVQPR